MSKQIEIQFSYDDKPAKKPDPVSRLVWDRSFDDLFAGTNSRPASNSVRYFEKNTIKGDQTDLRDGIS